jgi:tRNA(fMet)-specific endonuclease VapC
VARRLILDTGVLIAAERGGVELDTVVADDDDAAIAALTVAELLTGVELADDRNKPRRQQFVDDLLTVLPVEDYTTDVARVHSRLLAQVRSGGQPRSAYDLIIAATASATARTVVTTDAGFDSLPGVRAIVVPVDSPA